MPKPKCEIFLSDRTVIDESMPIVGLFIQNEGREMAWQMTEQDPIPVLKLGETKIERREIILSDCYDTPYNFQEKALLPDAASYVRGQSKSNLKAKIRKAGSTAPPYFGSMVTISLIFAGVIVLLAAIGVFTSGHVDLNSIWQTILGKGGN